jgi:NAD(P)-dependent dehydrogenase (short-subunit alcohol dehydrogenase family)
LGKEFVKAIADQTILVTGSTDGIGKQTAHDLAQKGATVLLHGRDRERAESTLKEIHTATGNNKLGYYVADFSSLAEVNHLALAIQAEHSSLDVLINNAGIGAGGRNQRNRTISKDGYELRFAVNYLASFLLTHRLLTSLHRAAPSRIINVSSIGQSPIDFKDVMLEKHYDPMQAYCQSKLALILFTFDLAEQLKDQQITVNCLHPGSRLNTKMVSEMFGQAWGSVQSGADAILYLATSPELEQITGQYFNQKQIDRADSQAYDREARSKLKELSEQLTELTAVS